LQILGTDYPTADGTCIRDYIHVNDLAEAHALALHRLSSGEPSFAVNLGTGNGHSILEILKSVEEVTGSRVNRTEAPRRAGDPPALVADPTRAQKLLGWKATRSLRDIVSTAWKWMEARNSHKP
jgi:UDP-glucose 4-epimerase